MYGIHYLVHILEHREHRAGRSSQFLSQSSGANGLESTGSHNPKAGGNNIILGESRLSWHKSNNCGVSVRKRYYRLGK